jgi:hypothetical protein
MLPGGSFDVKAPLLPRFAQDTFGHLPPLVDDKAKWCIGNYRYDKNGNRLIHAVNALVNVIWEQD